MKRDLKLIRVILAHIEAGTIRTFLESCDEDSAWAEGQMLADHMEDSQKKRENAQVVFEHVWLCETAGLTAGIESIETNRGFVFPRLSARPRLTNQGHDLLGAMRSDGLMEKLRRFASEKGVEVTLETAAVLVPKLLSSM